MDAAREYIEEAAFLSEQDALDENARAIWAAVNQLDAAALSRELAGLSGDLRGWVDLALIGRSRWLDNAAFERALAGWQGRYPNHPAGGSVLPTLAARPPATDLGPRRIGLLLPLSGQYAAAARAIQDGFIAAWYEDRGGDPERAVVVYDANASNVQALYDQAVDEGAEFIVGPLEKPAIQTLLKRGSLPVPTLALNQIDTPAGRDRQRRPGGDRQRQRRSGGRPRGRRCGSGTGARCLSIRPFARRRGAPDRRTGLAGWA